MRDTKENELEKMLSGSAFFILGEEGTERTEMLHLFEKELKKKYGNAVCSHLSYKEFCGERNLSGGKNAAFETPEAFWKWELLSRLIEDQEKNGKVLFKEEKVWQGVRQLAEIAGGKSKSFNGREEEALPCQVVCEYALQLLSGAVRSEVPYVLMIDHLQVNALPGTEEDWALLRDLLLAVKDLDLWFHSQGWKRIRILAALPPDVASAITEKTVSKEVNKVVESFSIFLP